MVENQNPKPRPRGRPQVRPDEETRLIIIEIAEEQFCASGYGTSNINEIARLASVSTKTLYRLFPKKADLFTSVVSHRIAQFVLSTDDNNLDAKDVRLGLIQLLTAYGRLSLSPKTVGITRLVLAEAERFPELATTFWEEAIEMTGKALVRWIERQKGFNHCIVGSAAMAAGMLRGMMAMEPQRAMMMGRTMAVDDAEIIERATFCADLFLHGASSPSLAAGGAAS